MAFSHLHVHTTYSIGDGLCRIKDLFEEASRLGQRGLAITDHGVMSGVPEFLKTAKKYPEIKPVVGCEFLQGFILLAKNLEGYHNLCRIASSFQNDIMTIVKRNKKGLIAVIGNSDEDIAAEFKAEFGDDCYVKNDFDLGARLGIKVVATNDVHFVHKSDFLAHDILLCQAAGTTLDDENRLRYTGEEYLKSEEEMLALFPDHPEALAATQEILGKVETYDISCNPELPDPVNLCGKSPDDRLRELCLESLAAHPHLTEKEYKERLDYELEVISARGRSDYFLILAQLVRKVRERGGIVGPGRGSAPGSLVNWLLGITGLDPIKNDFLFERFLNPDRNLMPDVDLDFDETGRTLAYKILQEDYGSDHVARIVTYGKRSPRTAVKDAFKAAGLGKFISPALKILSEYSYCHLAEWDTFMEYCKEKDEIPSEIAQAADTLDGTILDRGTHACGVLLSREPVGEYVPLMLGVDGDSRENYLMSQYDGYHVEDSGPVKFDFLSLRTLSVIKEIAEKERIDIDKIPLDDPDTLALFGRGDTERVFQFQSAGMMERLKELGSVTFNDIVAMEAMYRPGPMELIPTYIERRSGEPFSYTFDDTEDILSETYGVIAYQEQLMRIAQRVAGFSRGESDILRKAAGRRQSAALDVLKPRFIEGGMANGYDCRKLEGFWYNNIDTMEACYYFLKAHAASYAYLGYICGYLKAHYRKLYLETDNRINGDLYGPLYSIVEG